MMSQRRPAKGTPKTRPEPSAAAAPAETTPAATSHGRPEEPAALGWAAAALVFAVALLVRWVVGAQLADEPLFRSPQLDSLQYLTWGRRIAAGDFIWPVPPPHGLGYPVLLGALLSLFDGSLAAVRVAQSFLGAGTCALAAACSSRAFGRPAGIASGLLLAVYGPLVWIDVSILGEGLLVFLLALALWIVSLEGRPELRAVAVGVTLAAALLVRPTAIALLPGLLVALVLARRDSRPWRLDWRGDRRGWGAAGLLLASFLLVAVPVIWKISKENGAFVPVQGHGGFAFYVANGPHGDGLPSPRIGRGWEELETEAVRAGIQEPAARDRYYRDKTMAAIRERPGHYAGLFASKALWLVQAAEVRDSHSYDFFRSRSAALRLLPGFGLLFALALGGLAACALLRRMPPPEILLGLLGFALLTIITMVGTRYRMPMVPLLAVLAGPAVTLAWEAARSRRSSQTTRDLGIVLGAVLLGAVIANVRDYPPSHDFAEEWTMSGSALETQERFPEALAAYEQALASDPGYVTALEGVGRLRIKQGNPGGAEEVLRRTLAIKPDSQRAHYYLGVALMQSGRPDEAIGEMRSSLALAPEDVPTLQTLGGLLLAKGEAEEAATVYARLVEMTPGDGNAWLALARLEGARNRPAEGLPAARRAAELLPENAEAWLVLARLALDTRDAATAETALQRVDTLIGRSHPQVALSWAMLYRLQGRDAEAEAILRGLRPLTP
jgi:tetratricopeptide (TPR) repeat protein